MMAVRGKHKLFLYTVVRTVKEYFEVQAESEEEAKEILLDKGKTPNEIQVVDEEVFKK